MVSVNEVKMLSKRHNYEKNKKTHPFEMLVSPYITWVLINLGVTPNSVTLTFFCLGLTSAYLFSLNSTAAVILAFLFYRFHILLDVCDGEVARYTKKFSDIGKYLDLFTHQIVYPSVIAGMSVHVYKMVNKYEVLILGMILCVLMAFRISINSIVYRVNFNKEDKKVEGTKTIKSNKLKSKLIIAFSNVTSINLFCLILVVFKMLELYIELPNMVYILFLVYILLTQLLYIVVKVYYVFKYNKIPRREAHY
jgi:phosphatidylglycerophosphate synthase